MSRACPTTHKPKCVNDVEAPQQPPGLGAAASHQSPTAGTGGAPQVNNAAVAAEPTEWVLPLDAVPADQATQLLNSEQTCNAVLVDSGSDIHLTDP